MQMTCVTMCVYQAKHIDKMVLKNGENPGTEANELSIDEQVLDLVSRTNTFSVVTLLSLDQIQKTMAQNEAEKSLIKLR